MNFSKRGTIEKQRKIQSSSTKLAKKTNIIIYRLFLVAIILCMLVGSSALYGIVSGLIDNAPDINNINVQPDGYATYVYNTDNKMIQKLVGQNANREYVTIDHIPVEVQEAFIAIEDERFYEHNGIDVRGIFRAAVTGLSQGDFSQGASTLTQQLLKNQVFEGGNEPTFIISLQRKIQEQYLAIQLENRMNKEQILEYYLNTINLGANTLGVQAASNRYFNKKVADLTLSEAAVIAGITQSPANLNPIVNPDKNKARRLEVLNNMLRLNYITQPEYNEAIADTDDVYKRIATTNEEVSNIYGYNSYFVDEVISQVSDDLVEKCGYTPTQASQLIYRGGLRIYTTQDERLQELCDSVLEDESNYPKNSIWQLEYRLTVEQADGTTHNYSEGSIKNYFAEQGNKNFSLYYKNKKDVNKYIKEFKKFKVKDGDTVTGESINWKIQPQISFTLIDQHTGQVKAIVGGRGDKTGNRTLNRATDTVRQPGSTFKIVSTYLPALDTAGMTLASVIDDSEYYYPGSSKKVSNWSGANDYAGLTTIREAIRRSMNVVTVKTLEKVTPQVGFDTLQSLGFTTLVSQRVDTSTNSNGTETQQVRSDINLSLGLGGVTDGVTNLELTAAYAAIANGGVYNTPIFYTKVTDSAGKVILENNTESKQVMKESTAWLLTNAMEDVVKTGGTGTLAALQSVNMPVAGKTGTTSNNTDLWFSGYTPYYTASIWSGYDLNESQSNTSYHKVLWRKIMEKIHKNLPTKDFEKPDSIVSAKICTKSGKLAVDGVCDKALGGSTVRTEYFASGTAPTDYCDKHVEYTICTESGQLASDKCPHTKKVVYLDKDETGKTDDTPYIVPSKLASTYCTLHSGNGISKEPLKEEKPTPTPVLPDAAPTTPPATLDPGTTLPDQQQTTE
ncbi:MAG: transglycosylase domain-containing protein [bacterium]|nr:transglycosylase domain-containing protein [bacterium]